MIRYFVCDIDGCLFTPFQAPDFTLLSSLRQLSDASYQDEQIPCLALLSGRPQPYVEAVAQWLNIQAPVVFEAGAGLFCLRDMQMQWNPAFGAPQQRELAEIRSWMMGLVERYQGTTFEFTKRWDSGLVSMDKQLIQILLHDISPVVAERWPDWTLHFTDVSVNIIHRQAEKGAGIRWLAQCLNCELQDMAYIGDSGADAAALALVGQPFAPANASQTAKAVATVREESSIHAVLKVWQLLIDENRKKAGMA